MLLGALPWAVGVADAKGGVCLALELELLDGLALELAIWVWRVVDTTLFEALPKMVAEACPPPPPPWPPGCSRK